MEITPANIRQVEFKRAQMGRRGYDAGSVHEYLDQVGTELARLRAANERLIHATPATSADLEAYATRIAYLEDQLAQRDRARAEPPELHQLRRDLAAATAELHRLREESEKDLLGISTRAVNLLSQAQLSADTLVADAERYARDLVMTARDQHRDLLQRAQRAAEQAEQAEAPARRPGDAGPGYAQTIPEVEYLRTYTQIAATQLRSVLTALSGEVDKLADLPNLVPALQATPEAPNTPETPYAPESPYAPETPQAPETQLIPATRQPADGSTPDQTGTEPSATEPTETEPTETEPTETGPTETALSETGRPAAGSS
ncbi:DivIVA domain-containing protein [Rhodococcus sp. NPDC058532]|uniref:DivIVA domain-containing protein n=1 Tax=Rhodococcus sp. NPDC058532 TaxID=3346540 RepID=UPI0036477F29